MSFQRYQDLGHHITRIDTAMVRDELAACYLLKGGDDYAIIETGTHHTVPIILELLEQRRIRPERVKYVIPTHVHLDHAGGAGGLMRALPGATLLIHPRGARHMIDPARLKAGAMAVYGEATFARIYGDVIPVDESRVRIMEDGERLTVGDRELIFYDTPGHAKHHFCVHDPASAGIFTGDTFGISYPALTTEHGPFIFPTTTPVQFDPPALKASINTLLELNPERLYLTHYGMVEHPRPLGERLQGMIDDYVTVAESIAAGLAADEWQEVLQEAMLAYLSGAALDHGCQLDDDALEAMLDMDARLNSQGLTVWLQSRAES
ncbi:MBL fold metallo-hydrolase [Alcanivorax sp. N3-2A]|nr:MBL fold metallo-hydrolase [Alcanivorax sp. N3-2A]|tara:strand:+ start:100403 stop:101365 length:963 start_codon:yes stop_codon:yes gene_type:complete